MSERSERIIEQVVSGTRPVRPPTPMLQALEAAWLPLEASYAEGAKGSSSEGL